MNGNVASFDVTQTSWGVCVTDVLIQPNNSNPTVCLQNGQNSFQHCFDMPKVNQTSLDKCQQRNCSVQSGHGACLDTGSTLKCVCEPEYHNGGHCMNKKHCDPNPCINGASCVDSQNNYTCTCLPGYTGVNCSQNIDDCTSNPCMNGATCVDLVNDYSCTCPSGHYAGKNCTGPCDSNPCLNGGVCRALDATNHDCYCPLGFCLPACTPDPTSLPANKPTFSQLLPPAGSTITCQVNVGCDFPVYVHAPSGGSGPTLVPGPVSPVDPPGSVTVAPTGVLQPSLPGQPLKYNVHSNFTSPGSKQVCVQFDIGSNQFDSACYHINVGNTTGNQSSTVAPSGGSTRQPVFVAPSLPPNSILPCTDPKGCHVIVTTTTTPNWPCPNMTSPSSNAIIFSPTSSNGQCKTDVLVIPGSPNPVCINAGGGETRCYTVPLVNHTASDLCKIAPKTCLNGGACIAQAQTLNTSCVCLPYFNGSADCKPDPTTTITTPPTTTTPFDPCSSQPCSNATNAGICKALNTVNFTCSCPVGFSSPTCAPDNLTPSSQPAFSQLFPPGGSTITCHVNSPCVIPVYTTGTVNGQPPKVTKGPISPIEPGDIVIVDPISGPDPSLPDNPSLNNVISAFTSPGPKQLCVQIDISNGQYASKCYHINIQNPASTTGPQNVIPGGTSGPLFLPPSPPNNATLPCADPNGCHILITTSPIAPGGLCPNVTQSRGGVVVFPTTTSSTGQCKTDMLVDPNTPGDVCISAGTGENRCFKVPKVNNSAHALCTTIAPVNCKNHGSCIATPQNGTTACVCQVGFNATHDCQPASSTSPTTTSQTITTSHSNIVPVTFTTEGSEMSMTTFDPPDQCLDREVWRRAFKERRVTCTCRDPVTGEVKVVVKPRTPRVSTERIVRSIGIGASISTTGMIIAAIAYQVVKKLKESKRKDKITANKVHDFLFEDKKKKDTMKERQRPRPKPRPRT